MCFEFTIQIRNNKIAKATEELNDKNNPISASVFLDIITNKDNKIVDDLLKVDFISMEGSDNDFDSVNSESPSSTQESTSTQKKNY